MKLLLDTQAFFWFMEGNVKLSPIAKSALEEGNSELYLSSASVWETAIKVGIKKLSLPTTVDKYFEERLGQQVQHLPVHWRHAVAVAKLPDLHKDPFDRMLAAQAISEGMTLVSSDKVFRSYKVPVIW